MEVAKLEREKLREELEFFGDFLREIMQIW